MQNILDKLERVKKYKNGFKARCPAHPDRTQSLFLRETDKGIQLKCFASCSTVDIMDSIGMEVSDLFTERENMEMTSVAVMQKEKAEDKGTRYESIEQIKFNFKTLEDAYEYNYLGEDTSILQVRYSTGDGKAFATFHKEEDGWYSGRPEGLLPVYNIDEVAKAKAVLLVEGEKVCEILRDLGIHATTSLGGSNGAEATDFTSLTGKASVGMWRDNDEPGTKYQDTLKRILGNLNISLRCVDVEKFVEGKGDDLEQYIDSLKARGLSRDAIRGKIYSCIPKTEDKKPVDYLRNHLEKVKKGEIKNWDVPFFPILTKSVRAFKPGSQTVIVSAGGVGKSMLLGRFFDQLALSGEAKVKRLHLESSMDFYLKRSWAQQSSVVDVMNEEFHFNNPDESDRLLEQYEDVLNVIGETITTSDSGIKKQVSEWNSEGVMRWMTANADCDIIAIDPVSMVLDTAEVWKTSTALVKHAEELMSKNPRLCIIWIQHTAESPSGGNVGGIAGGKAWNKYSSSVLELIANDDPQAYDIMLTDGSITTKEVDVYIKVKKARNGAGSGWKIMMDLDQSDLTYKEMGRMLKKIK